MVVAPAFATGTYGAPQDAGVASATVTVGQQLGASIGTSLLNAIFAGAVASYLVAHAASAGFTSQVALNAAALSHGYDTAFWWTAAITAGGAVVAALLLRSRSASGQASPSPDSGQSQIAESLTN
jgi:hypothetical protein